MVPHTNCCNFSKFFLRSFVPCRLFLGDSYRLGKAACQTLFKVTLLSPPRFIATGALFWIHMKPSEVGLHQGQHFGLLEQNAKRLANFSGGPNDSTDSGPDTTLRGTKDVYKRQLY